MDEAAISAEYQRRSGDCTRMLREVTHQIAHLLATSEVTLGVPVEGRVKPLASLLEKIERKARVVNSVTDFADLIGVRVILLFHRDLDALDFLLRDSFDLVELSDTSVRLESSQFGYQSLHYVLRIKSDWLTVPSFAGLGEYVFEVQLRTLAQHIWAVASHKLQYKREASVPQPLKRSISRVSALLETVDMEFDRLLADRADYTARSKTENEPLNVDLLAAALDELLPESNKDEKGEAYDELLEELNQYEINTTTKLRALLRETKNEVAREDARRAQDDPELEDDDDPEADWDRAFARYRRGVYFTHAGLLRNALALKFGHEITSAWRLARE